VTKLRTRISVSRALIAARLLEAPTMADKGKSDKGGKGGGGKDAKSGGKDGGKGGKK
jgi:hypothetical protein